ncbi:MAG TPA: HNH endonuclease signature motif containing protein [Gemmata sp.]
MDPHIGHVYARRRSGKAEVVRVVAVVAGWAEFQFLHGPVRSLRAGTGRCKVKNFASAGWEPTEERADYSDLDGAARYDTFRVLDTKGEPILRCSAKRAAFYTRKGYAREVGPNVLQFTDPRTEDRLRELYLGGFTEFFMEVKNDRCVCCGATADLTRHHVIPKRHKKNVPQPWRSCLSNVLFVCGTCHRTYEEAPEPNVTPGGDWREYVWAWRDHFRGVLAPRFLPAGWDIISVQNFAALGNE